jgi:hypothetical protein
MSNPSKTLVPASSPIEIGTTVENGSLRIHRYRDHLVLWDLTNAGKRGKTVERATVCLGFSGSYSRALEFLDGFSAVLRGFSNYASALSEISDMVADRPDSLDVTTSEEASYGVQPAGFETLTLVTENISVEAGYKSFCIKDLKDKNNEPTAIPAIKGGKRAVQAFYHFLNSNRLAIAGMTYQELLQTMSRRGLSYHDYCAMD